MKLTYFLLVLLLLGCTKKDPGPSRTLTAAEQQLVGKWALVSIVNSTKFTNGAPTSVSNNNFQGSQNYLQFNDNGTWHELIGYDYEGNFTYTPPLLQYSIGKPFTVLTLTTASLVLTTIDSVAYQGKTQYYTIQVKTYRK